MVSDFKLLCKQLMKFFLFGFILRSFLSLGENHAKEDAITRTAVHTKNLFGTIRFASNLVLT